MWKDDYKVNIPEGVSGNWRVEKFTVTPEDEKWDRLRATISHSSGGRFTPAGTYTRLMRGNTVVMSDTPDEIRDHIWAIQCAKGHCLVNGLGLGVVVNGMLLNPKVERVTVIEISPDVIALVGPHYIAKFDSRLEIIQADAFKYQPPKGIRYGLVWHDIWCAVCADNLPEMSRLHRKYGRRAEQQGSWERASCERQRG